MPEGDTIYRAAARLRPVLIGRQLISAVGSRHVPDPSGLTTDRVSRIVTRGKHLLIEFSRGAVLHSHLGMTGLWDVTGINDDRPQLRRPAGIVLQTRDHQVTCYSPKFLRLTDAESVRTDRYLNRLGPDILQPNFADTPSEAAQIIRRFRRAGHLTIGEALLNQTIICGLGNVYKSEALFVTGTNPLLRVRALGRQRLTDIISASERLIRSNLNGRPRRTRFRVTGKRVWVYGRQGEPCLKCGERIQMIRQGDAARSTYFCPDCQPRIARSEESETTCRI